MAYMDTIADLVRRFRFLHDPARPEWQTAADVLAWAEDDLPDEVADRLVFGGAMALDTPAFPNSALSDGLADTILASPPEWLLASWRSWHATDRHELLVQGLVEFARTMTRDDYRLRYHSGDPYQARLLVMLGWLPSLLGAVVAGVAAAALAGDAWLFPLVALAALVLGYVATFGSWIVASALDLRWHLVGRYWWTTFMLIVLCTGPAVATLLAVLAVNLPADLLRMDIDLEGLSDLARRIVRVAFLATVVGWLIGLLQGC